MPFGKPKPTQFDQTQDKAVLSLQQNIAALGKNDQNLIKWINHLDQRLKTLEAYTTKKDTYDKQQDTQITDFINQFNNALSDLKAKSHEHTITQETQL